MARDRGIALGKILDILPHRYPFLMVDRVLEIVPRASIRGLKMVSANEPWAQGHFPGAPIFPGVLIIEALTQLGGILIFASEPYDVKRSLLYFLGIDKAKFRHMAVPGDRLELSVKLLHHRSNIWKLRGEAHVDDALCAEAELLASVVDRDDLDSLCG